jgi:hypothetical protein
MNRTHSALALSALAAGTLVLTATEAPAMVKDPATWHKSTAAQVEAYDWPDEGSGYPGSEAKSPEYNYPNYDPKYKVPPVTAAAVKSPSNDNGVEGLQAGASALGGAGVALGAMWLYRRRQIHLA